LRQQGARLAQCLLADDEFALATPLLRGGFAHITGLSFLRHDLHLHPPALSISIRLALEPYAPENPREFHHTLQHTYAHTLDCPEVNGVRLIEEVIEGHKAQGRFDPSRWWLARLGGQPVAVLLLVELADAEWEVAYLGVTPAARKQGVGRELLLRGLVEAREAGAIRVSLSVDDRNRPAQALYSRLGFMPYDHRQVLLNVWR
jgi:GNAT superfamily N-acetyltransferase